MVEKERPLLWSLVAALLVAGVAYAIALGGELRFADEREYLTLARSLTQGRYSLDGIHPNATRPIGYPLLLSVFLAAGAGVELLRSLNFLALAGSALLTWRIVKRVHGPLAGLVGAGLVAGYPVLFYAAGTLYPQTICAALLLLALDALFGEERPPPGRLLLAGSAFGLLLLMVPSFVFSLAVVAAWLVASRRPHGGRAALVLLLASGLMVGAWGLRNQVVFGRFVFGSANSGYMLLLGNSENATPNAGPNADVSRYVAETAGMDDVSGDAHYRKRATEYMAAHPAETLRLFLLKTLNYFNYRNDLATRSEASGARDLVMLATYGPLLLLFLWRVVRWRRDRLAPLEALGVTLYLANAPYAAVFFTRVRYRLPLDHLLIVVVAGMVGHLAISAAGRASGGGRGLPAGPGAERTGA
jgi:4-amino-4-deoxy-L-arabinose transferase-like glycosyltransferase